MRLVLAANVMMAVMASAAAAQPPVPAPAPAPAPIRAEPPVPASDQPNIQFDIAIADEGGGLPASKKNVVLMVQGGGAGSLRSNGIGLVTREGKITDRVNVELNADIKMPSYNFKEPNKVRARISIEYQPFFAEMRATPARVRAQVDVLLENGRKTVLWQTADPITGLRTTIEVTATVLK
jgi:hypothetical protein